MHFISILGAYLSVQPRTITIAHQCYKINPTEENSSIIPTPIIIPKIVRSTTLFFPQILSSSPHILGYIIVMLSRYIINHLPLSQCDFFCKISQVMIILFT